MYLQRMVLGVRVTIQAHNFVNRSTQVHYGRTASLHVGKAAFYLGWITDYFVFCGTVMWNNRADRSLSFVL